MNLMMMMFGSITGGLRCNQEFQHLSDIINKRSDVM